MLNFNLLLKILISAFRPGYSCQHLLLHLVEKWRIYLDSHEVVGALLTDLSKAFDSLPHHLLIAKLHGYGVDMKSTILLTDYLRNRKQRFTLGGVCGSWMRILRGVTQGSVLGPVVFNIIEINCMKANLSKFQMLTVGLDTKSDFKICIDDTEMKFVSNSLGSILTTN